MVWIAGGIVAGALALVGAAIAVMYAGTYASLFLHAVMSGTGSKPSPSPVTTSCEMLARLRGDKLRVRLVLSNQTNVAATAMTVYLFGVRFDPPIAALGDPSLTTVIVRMPAKSTVAAIQTVEQPSTISVGRKITAVSCDVYHIDFADGSEWQLPSDRTN